MRRVAETETGRGSHFGLGNTPLDTASLARPMNRYHASPGVAEMLVLLAFPYPGLLAIAATFQTYVMRAPNIGGIAHDVRSGGQNGSS